MTKNISIEPSTIETIDLAVYDWLNSTMNLSSNTNKGWRKVPIIWVGGERAHQIKADRYLRDMNGNFILPAITLQRESISKSLSKKGVIQANVPADDFRGGTLAITKKISTEKTSHYAKNTNYKSALQYNVKNKNDKVVYEVSKIPLPVYVDVKYTITVNTEYQQQMNELVQPFMTHTRGINSFVIRKEQHLYEVFFDKDSNFINDGTFKKLDENLRLFTTNFNISVLGYLLGSGNNEDKPKVVVSETIVEIKIPREKEMLGETTENDKKVY